MKKEILSERIPVKLWLDDIEDGALKQAEHLANFPFSFHHVAIMPDSHQGYGMPIGGVLATKDVIIPNAVGVDIGCGVLAVETSLTELDTSVLKNILGDIRKVIPVGFNHQKEEQHWSLMPNYMIDEDNYPVISNSYNSALKQLGTLGGGNHFIEIQKGNDNHIWVMIHSGSRNLGKLVAEHHNRVAIKQNAKIDSRLTCVDPKWELAFLLHDSTQGIKYVNEMQYCVDFALANRKLMMQRIEEIFVSYTNASFKPIINIAHNYARKETHFGEEVFVHRKGATSATKDEIGIIPGSQGTKSYTVRGLGNPESFQSCSHGAGRKMGRKQAQRELNLADESKKLDEQGILHAIRSTSDLDEAPGAYKDIDVVMENQKDLVEIVVELKPLAVIKG